MNNRTQNIRIGLRTKTLTDSCTSEVCMEMMSRATSDFLIIVIFLLGCFSNFVFGERLSLVTTDHFEKIVHVLSLVLIQNGLPQSVFILTYFY